MISNAGQKPLLDLFSMFYNNLKIHKHFDENNFEEKTFL